MCDAQRAAATGSIVGGRSVFIAILQAPEYIGPMIYPAFGALLRRLWGRCAICHDSPQPAICNECARLFASPAPRCTRCALPLFMEDEDCAHCARQSLWLTAPDETIASVRYAYPWDGLIQAFKFQSETGWAAPLGEIMCQTQRARAALERAQWVLPMPLSPARLRRRGFNQSDLLVRAISTPKRRQNLLYRTRDTAPQSGLGLAQRLDNLAGAFAVRPRDANTIRGAHVIVVDDVMTSGASVYGACQALREAGVQRVDAWVFARAE